MISEFLNGLIRHFDDGPCIDAGVTAGQHQNGG
jgi:hypothetical protein